MRSSAASLLLLVSVTALSACGRCGETVVVRKPYPGKAENLVEGMKPSLQAEQTLSGEFLGTEAAGTPTTRPATPG